MDIKDFYIIKRNTAALQPVFTKYGFLYTKVYEGPFVFLVKLSPLQIIKDSMHHYGHDWNGAVKAAKTVLGSIDMSPVKISGSLGLYWFPSKSPYAEDCIWFALDHIDERLCTAPKETKIFFPSGHHVTAPMSLKQFNKKMHRAQELKTTLEKRTETEEDPFWQYIFQKGIPPIVNDPITPYQINEQSEDDNIDDPRY
ncbi:ComK family protein [Bacillus freudenreichii]|nr:ComK family protein [Bacillus freudenreichii]